MSSARYTAPLHHRAPGTRDVQLVDVQTREGVITIALSRSDLTKGYLLTTDEDGRWQCACEGFRRRFDCKHVQTAGQRSHERRVLKGLVA